MTQRVQLHLHHELIGINRDQASNHLAQEYVGNHLQKRGAEILKPPLATRKDRAKLGGPPLATPAPPLPLFPRLALSPLSSRHVRRSPFTQSYWHSGTKHALCEVIFLGVTSKSILGEPPSLRGGLPSPPTQQKAVTQAREPPAVGICSGSSPSPSHFPSPPPPLPSSPFSLLFYSSPFLSLPPTSPPLPRLLLKVLSVSPD